MRLTSVLSSRDLPEPELLAAVLDGELARMGGAFCTVDAIDGGNLRAALVAAQSPRYAIAELHTAAWVYGATPSPPSRLQLGVRADAKIRPFSTQSLSFREVVIEDSEICTSGHTLVTTPLRTALDLARFCASFTGEERNIIGFLAIQYRFNLSDCRDAITSRRNLPHKNRALSRLAGIPELPRNPSERSRDTRHKPGRFCEQR